MKPPGCPLVACCLTFFQSFFSLFNFFFFGGGGLKMLDGHFCLLCAEFLEDYWLNKSCRSGNAHLLSLHHCCGRNCVDDSVCCTHSDVWFHCCGRNVSMTMYAAVTATCDLLQKTVLCSGRTSWGCLHSNGSCSCLFVFLQALQHLLTCEHNCDEALKRLPAWKSPGKEVTELWRGGGGDGGGRKLRGRVRAYVCEGWAFTGMSNEISLHHLFEASEAFFMTLLRPGVFFLFCFPLFQYGSYTLDWRRMFELWAR